MPEPASAVDPRSPSLAAEHVLIVDDDDATRSMYRRALARAALPALEAPSGFDALELLRSRRIALVLLDCEMPGLSGMDVIEKIRSDGRVAMVPIVMVTAADGLAAKVAGLQAGADDYLAKPVDLDELVARVRAQLRRSGSWQDATLASRRTVTLIEALASLEHGESPAVTATRVCALLHDELADAAIIAFGAEGARVLSSRGAFEASLPAGTDLGDERAASLRARCERGPWCGPTDPDCVADSFAPAACGVPLTRDGRAFGSLLLAAPFRVAAGPAAPSNLALMSAAGSLAPVISLLLAPARSP